MAYSVSRPNQVTGVYEVLAALKALDKNAARRANAAINKAAGEVATTARGLVDPDGLSGWQRQLPGGKTGARRAGYNPAAIAAGIKVKRKRQKKASHGELRAFVVISNTTAAGAIWEIAGRKSRGKTPSGMAMIRNIELRGGEASRTVWAAADQTDMANVRRKIATTIAEAALLAQSMINRA